MSVTQRTIVLTGPTSGIGLATARLLADRGDRLVLVARGRPGLDRVAAECARRGAEVLVVPGDVADPQLVEEAASAAEEQFGLIDVWVNNAAVAMFGRFQELPAEDLSRIVDVNVKGYAWGCQSALRRFRAQRRGVLINVGSANGRIGSPLSTAYVLTKFAISGMSEALRMELVDAPDIHVCTVLPASIDTPLYANAANYTGQVMGPAGPAFRASDVAAAIVDCIDRPVREVKIGWTGTVGQVVHQVSGGAYEAIGGRIFPPGYARHEPAPDGSGNLHDPSPGPPVESGGFTTRGGLIDPADAMEIVTDLVRSGAGALRRLVR